MRVKDVFLELSEVNNLLSIYDELVSHLDGFLDETSGDQIPLDGANNEAVDLGYIEQVKEDLISKRKEIDKRRDEILDWKVSDEE